MASLSGRCAVVALSFGLALGAASSRPFTVDLMLRDEAIGQVLVAPQERWAILEKRIRYDRAASYAYGQFTFRMLSRLLAVDLARPGPAQPLFSQPDDAGYWAAGFSPSGRKLAVYRLTAARLELGVVEMATHRVRWLGFAPDQPGAAPSPIWIDDRHLAVVALAAGELPRALAQPGFAARSQARGVAMMAGGRTTAVSMLQSGPARVQGVRRRLLIVDVATGAARLVATGDIDDVTVSADRRYLAVVRFGAALQPPPQSPLDPAFQERARSLSLIEFATGRRIDPAPAVDVAPYLLAWAPTGHRLLFYGRQPGSEWEAGALWQSEGREAVKWALPAAIHPVVERAQGILPIVHAAWMGMTPVVYARAGERSDWYALQSGADARALTNALAEPPPALTAIDAARLIFRSGDTLWQVDRRGRSERLASGVQSVLSQTPDPYQLGPRLWYNAAPQSVGTVAVGTGGTFGASLSPNRRWTLRPDERLLAHAPATQIALILKREESGAATVFAETPTGGRTALLALNQHLAGVERARAVAIAATDPAGKPVTHWLLLPSGAARRPPLVVIPYPGSTFTALSSPAPAPDTVVGSANGQLLAARGFAVLYPSLPLGYDVREPLPAIAAAVDRAIGAAEATGDVDPERVAIWGHSYGGYAALCAAVAGKTRYRAVIAAAGLTDLSAGYGTFDPQVDRVANGMFLFGLVGFFEGGQARMGAPPWSVPDRYLRNSPFFQVDKIRAPILLIHGDADYVPVAQAERMFTGLFRLGRDAELLRYPGEGHVLVSPADIRDQWRRVFAWLDTRLRSASVEPLADPRFDVEIEHGRPGLVGPKQAILGQGLFQRGAVEQSGPG